MAKRYDWGDGRKVHSRPATKREKKRNKRSRAGSGSGGGGDELNPYKIALDMATKAFAPAIKAAKQDVAGAQQHIKPGGALDKAYNQSGESIADIIKAAGEVTKGAQASTNEASKFTTDAAGQLGADQVAYANQQAALYGQTAKAAEVAAHDAGANVVQLGQAGQNLTGFLGALGSVQGNLGVSQGSANEARRGEARTEGRRALQARKDKLSDVRTKRGSSAQETAVSMAKDLRDFQLAEDTLGQHNADSRRDYLATLAGIRGQNKRQDDQQTFTSGENQKNREHESAENTLDRAGRLKTAKIQAKGKKNKDGSSAEYVNYFSGPKGNVIKVSPAQHRQAVEFHDKVVGWRTTVTDHLTDGKSSSKEEVRKRSGMRPGASFDLAWEMATRTAAHGKWTIPRKYRAFLKSKFPGGNLPYDIARLIEPAKK